MLTLNEAFWMLSLNNYLFNSNQKGLSTIIRKNVEVTKTSMKEFYSMEPMTIINHEDDF